MTGEHPEYRELLLLDSGELDAPRYGAIRSHVEKCPDCARELARSQMVFRAVAASERPRRRLVRPVIAASVAVAVIAYFLTKGTPSARADALLVHAVALQGGQGPVAWKLESAAGKCAAADLTGAGFCGSVASALREAGWRGEDLLSAKKFQDWRASRTNKTDSIVETNNEIEIATATGDGPIHLASLRLRTADHHPVRAHYEMDAASFDVVEMPTAPTPKPAASNAEPAVAAPVSENLEERVYLALHTAEADGSVLLDVERTQQHLRVWGLVPSDAIKQAVRRSLKGLDVTLDIVSEQESQAMEQPPAIPWQSFHGDAPPLAQEQLGKLFANDPQGRQRFLNQLDLLTRQLAGAARTRDALRRLKLTAAADFDGRMATLLQSIRQEVEPLTGPLVAGDGHALTYANVVELYTLVHQCFLLGDSSSGLQLPEALRRIAELLQ